MIFHLFVTKSCGNHCSQKIQIVLHPSFISFSYTYFPWVFFSKHLFRGSTVYSVNYLHGLIHSHQSYVLLYQLSYIKLKLKFMIIKQLKDIY